MRIQMPTFARRRRVLATIGVSAVVATAASLASVYEVGLVPPSIEKRQLEIGVGVTHALVDYPPSADDRTVVDGLNLYEDVAALAQRTGGLAHLMASPQVVKQTGQRLGVDAEDISAETEITDSVPRSLVEPNSERRANELLNSADPYRLNIQARSGLPMIDIYTQAPTPDQARRLADVSIEAFNERLRDLAVAREVPRASRVRLTQLGAARAGPADSSAPKLIALLTWLVVFGLCCGLIVLAVRIRRGWRGGSAASSPPERGREGTDDWPHTTRPLPWLIAGFIGILWLVPFNQVALNASLPIDLKLDRLVLPIIVLIWLVALAAGGPNAPRWRFTAIHAGVAAFALAAGLSVVLNAGELNQALVFGLSIKKLSLLAAYVAFFVVVASAVRRSEVRAFLSLILGLAVVCALGVIWEYRVGYNVFYEWTSGLLGGVFQVPTAYGGFDELGRRHVVGPAQLGLEAVAILSMALPIAIVRFMDAKRVGIRILYALAICIVGLAMLSTLRKSALLAPVSVGLTLLCFRPGAALKVALLGGVAVLVLGVFSFDAFDSVTSQLAPDRLDVATVSDRVADYDAVRPDVLSNPVFGAGFGSYEHTYAPADNRILDSDLLLRVVESGIAGLAAFLLMIGTVIAVAAPVIRTRDPRRSPIALMIAAGAVAFLVLAALFDEWSFPHAVYVFLTLAGLLAVTAEPEVEPEVEPVRARVPVTPGILSPAPVGRTSGNGHRRRRAPTPA
jgi:hypothetical protein